MGFTICLKPFLAFDECCYLPKQLNEMVIQIEPIAKNTLKVPTYAKSNQGLKMYTIIKIIRLFSVLKLGLCNYFTLGLSKYLKAWNLLLHRC